MLSRAGTRSLRYHSIPVFRQPLPLYQHSRTFAKNNKPKKIPDYKLPPGVPNFIHPEPTAQSTASRASGSRTPLANRASKSSDRPEDHDFSIEQDGVRTSAGSEENTVPLSEWTGPSATIVDTSHTSSHPEYSKLQDEFETTSSSDANTTPQSASPSAIDPAEARRREQELSQSLPDLTKGIPSTLDAEMAAASTSTRSASTNLNLTEDPSESSAGGRGGDELPKVEYISSLERRRNRLANWLYVAFLSLSISGTIFLGRNWETEEEELKHLDAPSGWAFGLFFGRAKARLADMLDYYNEPAFPKLLPDTDPTWERPYTLVLSLEDLLVHSEWTREHGWRMAKRPGVDYFLRYLSQYYELVIFTSLPFVTADPIIAKLDPYRIVMWPLCREATRYRKGEYIKDLSYLNRDLSKIIMLDTVDGHVKLQPENAIIVPKWKGDPQDHNLVSYIPFLEYAAAMGFDDLRAVLKSFEGKHVPSEFAQREVRAKEKFQKQLADERAGRPKRSGVGLLGTLLGVKPVAVGIDGMEQSLSEGFEQGKTIQDQIRERGQKQYELLEKEIRENGEKWVKDMAKEQEKAREEQMKGMWSSFGGFFGGGEK